MPDNHIPHPDPMFQQSGDGGAANGAASPLTNGAANGAANGATHGLTNGATQPGLSKLTKLKLISKQDLLYAQQPPAGVPGDVAMTDWDDLLNAVKSRLLHTANEDFSDSIHPPAVPERALEMIQSEMVECVSALNQLHTSLTNELARHKTLKLDIDAAQAALARTHHELVGTRALERRASHLAHHDTLTSLPNRAYFSQRLDQALALAPVKSERQTLAVMFLDLDGFKSVNDTHGHAIGDEVLKMIALRLSQSVRSEDVVSRFGGDEFACLLAGFPGREQLGNQARQMIDTMAAPVHIGELKLAIRPSIGIAMCPGDGLTGSVLLQHADMAMYRAKGNQSGYSFFDEIGFKPSANKVKTLQKK